jgi:hypothetical protein
MQYWGYPQPRGPREHHRLGDRRGVAGRMNGCGKHLKAHQQTRKALEAPSPTPVLHAAELDGNGQPIAEAIVVVD